ncbi:MAG: D-aminoacyl-tRNA deacylase [Candidatus Thermoplasmatota archaeon]|jgi:D-aminoacyl-tRNA deacylase|nr:D-aminoacyl-tRNA deacylase [Candidatus Thermoplasmatota archaeon]MDP7265905.1 D-aminoacyl-tRNA deacylase [Candidatus Thermoplasmatota archaeon]
MYLVVTSTPDLASMNIREKLLSMVDWEERDSFKGLPVYEHGELFLLANDEFHIYAEELDREIKKKIDIDFDGIIFASRHKAESGLQSLTVHSIGNFSDAKYGGRDRMLVPSMPQEITHAYRRLLINANNLDYKITFEATHHGPYLETPTMFIEIGSDEERWKDDEAGLAVAKTIMEIPYFQRSKDTLVGVGGGHYCPRHSDVVKKFDVAYGHIIPGWAIGDADDEAIILALTFTPEANKIYLHRKALKGAKRRHLESLFTEKGFKVVRAENLTPRQ